MICGIFLGHPKRTKLITQIGNTANHMQNRHFQKTVESRRREGLQFIHYPRRSSFVGAVLFVHLGDFMDLKIGHDRSRDLRDRKLPFLTNSSTLIVLFLSKRGPKKGPSGTFGSKSEMDLGQRVIQILWRFRTSSDSDEAHHQFWWAFPSGDLAPQVSSS